MPTTKRPCIEVTSTSSLKGDPVSRFAHVLRLTKNSTLDVENYNRCMLQILMSKGQIPKSNIIWRGDDISKIYNFKVDDSGKIEYINTNSNKSLPKRSTHAHTAGITKAELVMFKDAITRSQQMALIE